MKRVIYINWFPKGIRGKALWPWVFIAEGEQDPELINHELIHLEQQKEMLLVFAYCWYSVELLLRLLAYKFNAKKAYAMHSMEREARENEGDYTYIRRRDKFAFIMYL